MDNMILMAAGMVVLFLICFQIVLSLLKSLPGIGIISTGGSQESSSSVIWNLLLLFLMLGGILLVGMAKTKQNSDPDAIFKRLFEYINSPEIPSEDSATARATFTRNPDTQMGTFQKASSQNIQEPLHQSNVAFAVQFASFDSKALALQEIDRIQDAISRPLEIFPTHAGFYRVIAGGFQQQEEAVAFCRSTRRKCLVKTIDPTYDGVRAPQLSFPQMP